jgi:site-specific recombinase XerD
LVGDIPPEKATYTDVDRFINQQLERGYKPATINRRLTAIQSLYTYLCDEQPGLVCPVLPHRHYLREPQRLPRPVQEENLRLFFGIIQDARDKAMFTLMLRCGLRIGEVAGLKISNLYLNEVRPRIITRGKGTRERVVYLSPQAHRILRIYLAERPDVTSDFVFLSYLGDGMSTTAIHKRLMYYRTQAEIYLTAHQLRHSFANDLLCANVPVTTIQKLLGHRWLETTQIYVEANDFQVQADYYAACLKIESWLI